MRLSQKNQIDTFSYSAPHHALSKTAIAMQKNASIYDFVVGVLRQKAWNEGASIELCPWTQLI